LASPVAMARIAARRGEADAQTSIKLHVASTGWPYKPNHAPCGPLVLLHGAAQETLPAYVATSGHICRRYAKLICGLLHPEHDDLFIIDVSQVATPTEWRSELRTAGRHARMLERWFTKFNPSNATFLVHGEDAALVAPLLMLGGEQRIARVMIAGGAPAEWLSERLAKAQVEIVSQETVEGVATALGRSPSLADEVATLALSDLHFVSVEFTLNPRSKQLVQNASNITASVVNVIGPATLPVEATTPQTHQNVSLASGPRPVVAVPKGSSAVAQRQVAAVPGATAPASVPAPAAPAAQGSSSTRGAVGAAVEGVATHHLLAGMSFSGLVAQVVSSTLDGSVLRVVLADCHGSIETIVPREFQAVAARDRCVSVAGRVVSADGCLYVMAERVVPHSGLREGYLPVRQGQRNSSEWPRRYGCLVLRGDKCVLVRHEGRLQLPTKEARTHETAEQAATRAVAELCDIYPEEVALLHDVAPAVAYDGEPADAVVRIFAALATRPPPAREEDDDLSEEDDEDLYDWFGFEKALKRLTSNWERSVVTSLAQGVSLAVSAGIVAPEFPCSFGPPAGPSRASMVSRPASSIALTAGTVLAAPPGALPIVVVSGLAGSGKTTLLRHILEKTQGLRIAVLLNSMAEDSGSESLAEHPNIDCRPERLLELSDGCACCTLAEEFAEEIVGLAAQRSFDYLIVEASSIADPSALAKILTSPGLRDLVRLDALVTVVEGIGFPTDLAQATDRGPLQQLMLAQVAFATTVILNKCDLLSQQRTVDIRAALQRLNPGAAIHEAMHANVPMQAVINTGIFSHLWAESTVRWLRELQQPKNAEADAAAVGIGTLLYRRQTPFHPQRLGVFLTDPKALPSLVSRAKGRVWLATRPKYSGRLNCVGERCVLSQGPAWQTADGKVEPRRQEIILTGNFNRQTVEAQLDACLVTPSELAQSSLLFPDEVLLPWPEDATGAGPD